jgi:hypothetical protein
MKDPDKEDQKAIEPDVGKNTLKLSGEKFFFNQDPPSTARP